MARERTHYECCWRAHDECTPTVLDEATDEVTGWHGDTRVWADDARALAAVVLRVAADRLRACAAERDTEDCEEPPWHDAMDRAADMLTEGVDDGFGRP